MPLTQDSNGAWTDAPAGGAGGQHLNENFTEIFRRSPKVNFTALVPPDIDNDSTQGYSRNSIWIDTTLGIAYRCINPAVGAAVWSGIANHEVLANHISDTANPHATTAAQVGAPSIINLSALEAKVDDIREPTSQVLSGKSLELFGPTALLPATITFDNPATETTHWTIYGGIDDFKIIDESTSDEILSYNTGILTVPGTLNAPAINSKAIELHGPNFTTGAIITFDNPDDGVARWEIQGDENNFNITNLATSERIHFSSGSLVVPFFSGDGHEVTNLTLANIPDAGTAAGHDANNAPGEIPLLDGSGLLATSVIPPLLTTEVTVVDSEAEMLALTAQRGDMAIRTDDSKTYVLSSNDPTILADWKEIISGGTVNSVNGQTGNVVLTADDVGAYTESEVNAAFLPKASPSWTGSAAGNGSGITNIDQANIVNLASTFAAKAPINNATFTGTSSFELIDYGATAAGHKVYFYHSGTIKYGIGVGSGIQFFAPDTDRVNFGSMLVSNGTTFVEQFSTAGFAPFARFKGSLATGSVGTEQSVSLVRDVNSGVSWPQVADIKLGRYSTSGGVLPQTRLDFTLKNDASLTLAGDITVLTLSSDGTVNVPLLLTANHIAQTQQTLTDGATINWDMNLGGNALITWGGNRTVAAPTNLKAGTTYILISKQDATGNRIPTWNAVFKWSGGVAPALSTGGNAIDKLSFYCDGTNLYGTLVPNFS